ncbi:polysaccharide biosynthesis/export family protein [Microvirga roseola]|uniref:polysaccharide biosynthesis/export family protein n=1 Tax=Microvirga roseola TaxID=2883126 RepID=UPI001E4F8F4F|nr:polysaccharide biosynthesis/export family protein [Microvirga roseola]
MAFLMRRRRSLTLGLHLPLALLLASTAARAEYRIQPGDILEITVTGVPELKQRSPVGIEGDVSVALAGQVKVRGLTIAEARAKIVEDLSNKVYQQRAADGREIAQLIMPDAVLVNVVEFRPVYLNGDVAKPGEQIFRPGMTIRHAIAVAGGYDALQFRGDNLLYERLDLRAEYDSLWTELAREQARIWRIRTELGYGDAVKPDRRKIPLSQEVIEHLIRTEEDHLKARTEELRKEQEHYRNSIESANSQLKVLAEKKKQDEEAVQADVAEFDKVRELFQKGITATTRLSEARRSVVMSSTHLLQTVVEITNIERQREEFGRLLERAESQSRIEALKELQEANLRLEQVSAKLQGASEKLRIRSGEPEIWLYRAGEKGTEQLPANEDMELMPGDVVSITLRTEGLKEAQTR